MLLAGATAAFVPHAGKIVPRSRHPSHSTPIAAQNVVTPVPLPTPAGWVMVSTEFRLAPSAYDHLIDEAAERYKLDPALIRAVITVESAFDPNAVSQAGAQGLMQLMPELAEELGVQDSFDPRENIMAGSKYLGYLMDVHKGNEALALASYNAGPTMVDRYHGVPPFEETRRYVRSIQDILKRNRAESAD
jgi:soluble lytic murein transglycosylase-like protein